MYGSFEDFAIYANDREMDTFGTQEFFDYHNAKREEAANPQISADTAQPVETSIAPTSEGVNVAARDTGVVSDAADPFAAAKRVTDISSLKPVGQAWTEWKPNTVKDIYRTNFGDFLIGQGIDERTARRVANNILGTEGGELGLADFEPVAVTHGGVQAIRRGIESGDKLETALGVVDVLFGGLPAYRTAAGKAIRGGAKVLAKKFGDEPAEATKLDAASGSLEPVDSLVRQPSDGADGTLKQRVLPLHPLTPDEKLDEAWRLIKAGATKAPVTQTARTINSLRGQLKDGKITGDAFVDGVTEAMNKQGVARDMRYFLKPLGRTRGHAWVKSWLNQSVAKGDLQQEAVELYEFLANKNPNLAKDMSVSVRVMKDPKTGAIDDNTGGEYDPREMLMTINSFFSKAKNKSAYNMERVGESVAHEFLHHTERVLPEASRDAITRQWAVNLAKRLAKTKDPELKKMYETILAGDNDTAIKMFTDLNDKRGASIMGDEYQYISPSEWWAENGVRILKSQKDATGIKDKTIGWYKEILSFAKDKIGFASDYPAYAALNDLVKSGGDMSGDPLYARQLPVGAQETGWQNIGKAGVVAAPFVGAYAATKDKERK